VQRRIGIEPQSAGDAIRQSEPGVIAGQLVERRADRSRRLEVGHSATRRCIDRLRHHAGIGTGRKGGSEEEK
jgi:hypothetical protein